VLDKGIVIAGDITVSLGQVELLSIKLRLIVASIDKAQEIGIDWWRSDPYLSSHAKQMEQENELLKSRLDRVENQLRSLPAPQQTNVMPQPASQQTAPHQQQAQPQQAQPQSAPQQAQPQSAPQQTQPPQQQQAQQGQSQSAPQQQPPQQGTDS
jgi:hypothetical protein